MRSSGISHSAAEAPKPVRNLWFLPFWACSRHPIPLESLLCPAGLRSQSLDPFRAITYGATPTGLGPWLPEDWFTQKLSLCLHPAHKARLLFQQVLVIPPGPGASTERGKLPATAIVPTKAWHPIQILPKTLGWSRVRRALGLLLLVTAVGASPLAAPALRVALSPMSLANPSALAIPCSPLPQCLSSLLPRLHSKPRHLEALVSGLQLQPENNVVSCGAAHPGSRWNMIQRWWGWELGGLQTVLSQLPDPTFKILDQQSRVISLWRSVINM